MRHTQLAALALPSVLALAACSSSIVVTEVLNHHTCQLRSPGVKQISHAELPALRGARLLLEPGAREPDFQGADTRYLVVVSRGAMPTGGYALTLESATQTGGEILLDYTWTEPAPDSVRAQMVTHPCSAVELEDPASASLADLVVTAQTRAEDEVRKIGSVTLKPL